MILKSKLFQLTKYAVNRACQRSSWSYVNSLVATVILASAALYSAAGGSPEQQNESLSNTVNALPTAALPELPTDMPAPGPDGIIYLQTPDGPRATTLNPGLQAHLDKFLEDMQRPIAAVVVVEVKTGRILAMAQGRSPSEWATGKSKVHSALQSGFPAASLFKTVVIAADFELTDADPTASESLFGGCSHVRPTGVFMTKNTSSHRSAQNSMTLRKAYARSCNGFFAKLAVNHLGLGIITNFAHRFGWETDIPTDFHLDRSPFRPPAPENSSAHTVGRFAAGFGYVGLSAVHSAWTMLVIARDGVPAPITLFRDTPVLENAAVLAQNGVGGVVVGPVISSHTAASIRSVMQASVQGGTASHAFRRGKYRKLREIVGGKTGTLTGQSPKGLTTWFSGMAPLDAPEIVVASVVMLESKWLIKGTHLAAESIWAYYDQKVRQQAMTTAAFAPVATTTAIKEKK
jgi:cell division protein FtsI/penicillin-binding protein 2